MKYFMKLYSAPATEPVSVAEAKTHCRVDTSADDTYIGGLITTAREHVEELLGRALITQTWDMVLDAFPSVSEIKLPRPPLVSVTSITYTNSSNVASTFAAANYYVDTYAEPGRVKLMDGKSWPADTLRTLSGVVIRYQAGYGAAAAVPGWAKQAILLLVGDLYENREDTIIGSGISALPSFNGMMNLLYPRRISMAEQ